jgi:hypothetical protein
LGEIFPDKSGVICRQEYKQQTGYGDRQQQCENILDNVPIKLVGEDLCPNCIEKAQRQFKAVSSSTEEGNK